MIIEYLSVLAFLLLVVLAASRGFMLRKRGINAFVFGVTDKSDFLLMPCATVFVKMRGTSKMARVYGNE